MEGTPFEFCHQNWQANSEILGYIVVKTARSYLQPFCHNTLTLQTTERQHFMTIAELAMQLQRSAKTVFF